MFMPEPKDTSADRDFLEAFIIPKEALITPKDKPNIILRVKGYRQPEALAAMAEEVARELDEFGVAAVDDKVTDIIMLPPTDK